MTKNDLIGYVYLLSSKEIDNLPIKIGYSNNLEQRLISLQNCCPIKLEYLKLYPISFIFPHILERMIHYFFLDKQLYSEWFNLSFEEAERGANIVYRLLENKTKVNDVCDIEKTFLNSFGIKTFHKSLPRNSKTWVNNRSYYGYVEKELNN